MRPVDLRSARSRQREKGLFQHDVPAGQCYRALDSGEPVTGAARDQVQRTRGIGIRKQTSYIPVANDREGTVACNVVLCEKT